MTQITEICSRARQKQYVKGELIFLAAEPVSHVYLVQRGTVKEYYISDSGEDWLIQRVNQGECPALPALFTGEPHTSNAEAMDRVDLLRWEAAEFVASLRTNHFFCRNILRMLAGGLERARRQCCLYHRCSADTRVAHFLVERLCGGQRNCSNCRSPCLDLRPLSVTAQEIGLARETLTRVLGRFNKKGCIKLCHGRITDCDLNQIKGLAGDSF